MLNMRTEGFSAAGENSTIGRRRSASASKLYPGAARFSTRKPIPGQARRDMSHDLSNLSAMAPVVRRGVAAVVMRDDRFLVIRRSAHVLAAGLFCFPGGGIEPGESEPQALVREFQEELGVPLRPCRRIWRCQTRWQIDLAWWLAELSTRAVLVPDPAEVESIHWLTTNDLSTMDNLLDSNHDFLRRVMAGQIALR